MKKRTARSPSLRESPLELSFAWAWSQLGGRDFAAPEKQHRFHAVRQWRFDFAWPLEKLAVEIEGGVLTAERKGHATVSGILRDIEKYNAAAEAGWLLLRFTAVDLQRRPVQVIEQVLRTLHSRRDVATHERTIRKLVEAEQRIAELTAAR